MFTLIPQDQIGLSQAWLSPALPQPLDLFKPETWPLASPLQKRNTAYDQYFYNIKALNPDEIETLTAQNIKEGRVIIVDPSQKDRGCQFSIMADYQATRDEPGDLLEYFSIAGVGSSDLGAVALAREVANAVGAPVGAIVAGYGVADVMSEALGGWFFLGARNRMAGLLGGDLQGLATPLAPSAVNRYTPDSQTLLKFLGDDDRTIKMLVGHSKGCLSIADALNTYTAIRDPKVRAKLEAMTIVTMGAVVSLPQACQSVFQYLGDSDPLGKLNSRASEVRYAVPNTEHHLNPNIARAMRVPEVLSNARSGTPAWPRMIGDVPL